MRDQLHSTDPVLDGLLGAASCTALDEVDREIMARDRMELCLDGYPAAVEETVSAGERADEAESELESATEQIKTTGDALRALVKNPPATVAEVIAKIAEVAAALRG